LGEAMVFTNQTTGTAPFSYWWDFGDGLGTSTDADPSYTYLSTGTFTVTLTATNSVGADSASHAVVVEPRQLYFYLPLVVKNR
ncbi:MAG: PKD domain-containing protein, partial [Anaerolineae bacterium]|nr:PKD domain-containing protein [Anaerolineae bacterium]